MNNNIITKNHLDAIITHGPMLSPGSAPPANPISGSIYYNTVSGTVLKYTGTKWIEVTTMEQDIDILIRHVGNLKAYNILLEEIVEQKMREDDPELQRLWEEYKTLAKLKTDYEKDLDEIINDV